MYPTANPTMCKPPTAAKRRGNNVRELNRRAEFSATTPPQIKAISKTDPNGVKRLTCCDNLGARDWITMPINTGNKTTRAVATTNALPETATVLPTNSLTNRGVSAEAKMVEQAVRMTLKATSAWAIKGWLLHAQDSLYDHFTKEDD